MEVEFAFISAAPRADPVLVPGRDAADVTGGGEAGCDEASEWGAGDCAVYGDGAEGGGGEVGGVV